MYILSHNEITERSSAKDQLVSTVYSFRRTIRRNKVRVNKNSKGVSAKVLTPFFDMFCRAINHWWTIVTKGISCRSILTLLNLMILIDEIIKYSAFTRWLLNRLILTHLLGVNTSKCVQIKNIPWVYKINSANIWMKAE